MWELCRWGNDGDSAWGFCVRALIKEPEQHIMTKERKETEKEGKGEKEGDDIIKTNSAG